MSIACVKTDGFRVGVTLPSLLVFSFVTFTLQAYAGYYEQTSQSGGLITRIHGGTFTYPYGPVTGGYGGGRGDSAGTLTGTGTITTVFQWHPEYDGEEPPDKVIACEHSAAVSDGTQFSSYPICTADNGLGKTPETTDVTTPGTPPLPNSYHRTCTSSSIRSSIHDGGATVTISCTPSTSVTTSSGAISTSVTYSVTLAWGHLKSVVYSGSHMNSIAQDDQSGNYGTPHWQDNSEPLDGDALDQPDSLNPDNTPNTEGDHRFPVCFNRSIAAKGNYAASSSTLSLSVTIQFDPGVPSAVTQNTCRIKGWSDKFTVGSASGNAVTLGSNGTQIALSNVECKKSDGTTYKFPENIDAFTSTVHWQFSWDSGAIWYDVEDSDNRLYVVGGETSATNTLSTPSSILETALDVACRHTTGDTTNANIVTHVFDSFVGPMPGVLKKDKDGHNVQDGAEMVYWLVTDENHDTAGLVKDNHGACDAWTNFYKDALAVHSISATKTNVSPGATANYPPPDVNSWSLVGSGISVDASKQAQGNSTPPNLFNWHYVSLIPLVAGDVSKTVYDSSYASKTLGNTLDAAKLSYQNATFTGTWRKWTDTNGHDHCKYATTQSGLWTDWTN